MLSGHDSSGEAAFLGFPANDPIIYLETLCSHHLHATALHGFRAAESGEEICMILHDISYVQFKTVQMKRRQNRNTLRFRASLAAH